MKKLSIKQKQEIYEHLLKKDCPDLLAALVAERSTSTLQQQFHSMYCDSSLSDFILGAFSWDESVEGHDFWSILRQEFYDIEKGSVDSDFESPTTADFAPVGNDSAKVEILVDTSIFEESPIKYLPPQPQAYLDYAAEQEQLKLPFLTRVKLFFGKWNYKV